MAGTKTGGDRYFDERMKDPEFARGYRRARQEIDSVDELIRELDRLRILEAIDKTALARQIGMVPSVVRRLLTARGANPGLRSVLRVANELGYTLTWTRLPQVPNRAPARRKREPGARAAPRD